LEEYYKLNFALAQHHKYSLDELGSIFPFEREIYVTLLSQYLAKVKAENDRANRRR
jgi:hypothetical protein